MKKFANLLIFSIYSCLSMCLLFVFTGCAGSIWRVSVDANGNEANGGSYDADIVQSHVTYTTFAPNLAAGSLKGLSQIVDYETTTGTLKLVSMNSTNQPGDAYSNMPSISNNGQFIAFQSKASNLVSGDKNPLLDIYVYNLKTGKMELVSVDSNGNQGLYNNSWPSISEDGRYVAFESQNALVLEDTNGEDDVYVRDRLLKKTERVSISSGGTQANNASGQPSISSDGRYVAFFSKANNLVPNDTNGWEVFVYDRQNKKTERISVSSNGIQGNSWSLYPSISSNGRFVAYISDSSNLVNGDTNGKIDVFVYDRQTGKTERVSLNSNGGQANDKSGYLSSPKCVSISGDGNFIVFESDATNLVTGDTNNREDVFLHDRTTKKTVRLSVSVAGIQGNGHSDSPVISPDGKYVIFKSTATNLVKDDLNKVTDVFMTLNPLSK